MREVSLNIFTNMSSVGKGVQKVTIYHQWTTKTIFLLLKRQPSNELSCFVVIFDPLDFV